MAHAIEGGLGATLRSLRVARGLGLGEAARRGGTAKATLGAWEVETRLPRGPALDRLLDALGADDRTKARLLSLTDPRHARITLADSPFCPVNVGTVLRAMRERRGIAQADLARRLDVSQATVSRWESGDDAASPETLHALGFALGAAVEETLALASAGREGNAGIPGDPQATLDLIWEGFVFHPLLEVRLLGLEAELWRRSSRDARWDPCLASVLSARACLLVGEERYQEVASVARQSIRVAEMAGVYPHAVPAIGALSHARRHLGRAPKATAEMTERWAGRLPDSSAKAWMLRQRGMSLVQMDRVAEGVEWVARSSEMELQARPDHPDPWSHRAEMLAEAYLEAGDPRRAASIVGRRRERRFPSNLFIRIEHALGKAATEADMAYLRFYTNRHDGTRLARRRLAEIERRQARLKGARTFPSAAPPSDDPRTGERLWAAVLREHQG